VLLSVELSDSLKVRPRNVAMPAVLTCNSSAASSMSASWLCSTERPLLPQLTSCNKTTIRQRRFDSKFLSSLRKEYVHVPLNGYA
jgi:hypothetical protein